MNEHPINPSDSHEHECGANVAAYALNALEDSEAAEFAVHLRGCTICRDELETFRAVVDVLPLTAAAVAPRRAVKRNVMAIVNAEQRAAAAPQRRRMGRWAALVPSPRLGLALAVVLAALLIGGGVALQGSGAPRTRVLSAQVIGGPGTAQVRLTGDRAELIVNHLPQPPSGHIYEVWLQRGRKDLVPTNALFGVSRDGRAEVDVPGSVRGVMGVLVTPEPAGGSQVPTHVPVIRAEFS